MKHLTRFCYWIIGSFLGFGLAVGCSRGSTQPPTAPTEELMTRIGSLEEENKKLKAENSDLKAQLGITDDQEETDQTQEVSQEESPTPAQGGKMIGGTPKGGGKIELQNASGQGDHIVVIADKSITFIQVAMNFENVEADGSEPTKIYVDGKEKFTSQLSKESMSQTSLDLEGQDLKKGIHNVEVIQEINGVQSFYRLLTYEVK